MARDSLRRWQYGDKMSPAIWDGVKTQYRADAAAPTPAALKGPSLYSLQIWADAHGYDAFLLGAAGRHQPVFIGLTGLALRQHPNRSRATPLPFSARGLLSSHRTRVS